MIKLFKKIKDDRGITIMVTYVLFLPVFLFALVMLFELSKMQSLKNINEIVTEISSNAAVRQIDYVAVNSDIGADTVTILDYYSSTTATAPREQQLFGLDANNDLKQNSKENTLLKISDIIQPVSTEPDPRGLPSKPRRPPIGYEPITIDTYDEVSSQAIAQVLYLYNISHNGLLSEVNKTSVTTDSFDIEVNNQPASYTDLETGKRIQIQQPSVYVRTRIIYDVNPILKFISGNLINEIYVGGSSVSQIVSSPSNNDDRYFED